jgi:cytochrome c oxidase subunit 4
MAHPHKPAHHVVPVGVYLLVFGALLLLTFVTVIVAEHDFGRLNTPIALTIAIVKATLVILFFMHVKYSSRLTWLVAGASFIWLAMLLGGVVSDYWAPRFEPGARPGLSRQ